MKEEGKKDTVLKGEAGRRICAKAWRKVRNVSCQSLKQDTVAKGRMKEKKMLEERTGRYHAKEKRQDWKILS
jgi:hypothetical protein